MKNRIKAEYIILKENHVFFWVLQAAWIIVAYNIYHVCVPSVTQMQGGFYTSNILALLFVLGIFFPIFLGAILGGFDYDTSIMDYKLSNESQNSYLRSKLILMAIIIVACVLISFVAGIFLDLSSKTFQGGTGTIFLNLKRVVLLTVIWMVWGCISFFVAILSRNVAVSVVCSILIFYLEQFLNNYLPTGILKYGVVWNQKSLLGQYFSDDRALFGIVQTSFNSFGLAITIVVFTAVLSIWGSKFVLLRRYGKH